MNPDQSVSLIDSIRRSYEVHPGYRHWIWQWFGTVELDYDLVKKFAVIYYQHVLQSRMYPAGLLSIAPFEHLQTVLAETLVNESDAPEMFRNFMRTLELTELDWEVSRPIPGIEKFHAFHFSMIRGGMVSECLGAVMFGMASTAKHRHTKILEGLKRYEARSGRMLDLRFFARHIDISRQLEETLCVAGAPIIVADSRGVARGAQYSLDAREFLLDDLGKRLTLGDERLFT